ncbi:uncharacterized protein [Rhodnius prolixus]|uniref:uncharacterized protein n=1 Tax=Rhodnius prolixus TaxID=13249 RepID=UPI003D18D51B
MNLYWIILNLVALMLPQDKPLFALQSAYEFLNTIEIYLYLVDVVSNDEHLQENVAWSPTSIHGNISAIEVTFLLELLQQLIHRLISDYIKLFMDQISLVILKSLLRPEVNFNTMIQISERGNPVMIDFIYKYFIDFILELIDIQFQLDLNIRNWLQMKFHFHYGVKLNVVIKFVP